MHRSALFLIELNCSMPGCQYLQNLATLNDTHPHNYNSYNEQYMDQAAHGIRNSHGWVLSVVLATAVQLPF
jgi:hypothetical protein